MKIALIQFPGSSGERETRLAIQRAGMEPVDFLWNASPHLLEECAGFVIVGGASYEDRPRAGALAALDPVMVEVARQAARGKPVLGIGNGAQIVVEAGLVPGVENNACVIGFSANKRIAYDKVLGVGFYNASVSVKRAQHVSDNAFTLGIDAKEWIKMPVAHAQGCFVVPDDLLAVLHKNGQIVFQYCDEQGLLAREFPTNPNGSVDNIAAMMNARGNVMAMMPHPERTPCGDVIFESIRDRIAEREAMCFAETRYSPPAKRRGAYVAMAHEILVESIGIDEQAVSVQNALRTRGIPVSVKRFDHWEIACAPAVLPSVLATDVLWNPRQACQVDKLLLQKENTHSLFVCSRDNSDGLQKGQVLANHFEVDGVKRITHGVIWLIKADQGDIEEWMSSIMALGLLVNHASQLCFDYA
jgi:phosphoribosylformylglycinamidine synthase subunit PurQ / glutaminase